MLRFVSLTGFILAIKTFAACSSCCSLHAVARRETWDIVNHSDLFNAIITDSTVEDDVARKLKRVLSLVPMEERKLGWRCDTCCGTSSCASCADTLSDTEYICSECTSPGPPYPCPAGKCNPTKGETEDACLPCAAETYSSSGSESETNQGAVPCAAGRYCSKSSTTDQGASPCSVGNYCPEASITSLGDGPFAAGCYCPESSSTDQGAGSCAAGYYYPHGSATSQGAGACIAGEYAPPGSGS
ncbi:hypothetical protein TrLO_g9322 [Triparma laevis f. longispina]|uniref:Uncharacterized protein n=1 Tax=Triparma laevis f. longispina TaxID=1714387 RepID=A0A9W6ZHJ9_9STRA|nr:hypothetical protein TrLO_g9322 [Triparma laevis f. longispina]